MPALVSRNGSLFDPEKFLSTSGLGKEIQSFSKKQIIFAQGDPADSVFYIRNGKVRLTVVAKSGKEATIAILGRGDYFGEGCLEKQPLRKCSATALTDCWMLRITKEAMLEALHEEGFSSVFLSYLLRRNIRYEEDLVDQLFNSSEQRLARVLLLLSQLDQRQGSPGAALRISQETLAQMVGTTRSRVNFFMNRFKKLGFIEYNNGLRVRGSIAKVFSTAKRADAA